MKQKHSDCTNNQQTFVIINTKYLLRQLIFNIFNLLFIIYSAKEKLAYKL